MSESVSTAEAPRRGGSPGGGERLSGRGGIPAAFLAPALVLLGVWIVYPTVSTIIRSFYDRSGDEFVGVDNYETLFTDDTLLTAIKNNFLWILVVPALVTAIGLVFAVLLERVRFATAFKVAVFMPMAISLFAAGVIWRLMYEKDADQGVVPEALSGGITGVVWRDFTPRGGTPGVVDDGEQGLPGVTVELREEGGRTAVETTTEENGTFAFEEVEPGSYRAAIGSDTFSEPYAGVSWLGEGLILPAVMIAYIWVWAGFAMVVIAAGLAAIPRDLLEAARTDGATELQVFRRVTIPLLAPVLTVVFITMLIYVLKVFDIVIAVAPGAVQDDANVIALAMWRTAFGGVNNHGLGAAIAVFLFLLVIPILAINIRRFRREV